MKKCPYCSEEILDEAIKCKHCGEFLDDSIRTAFAKNKLPWYFKKSAIIVSVCCVGPLALPLIWWRPHTSRGWKIGLTILIAVLTWISYITMKKSLESISELYNLI